jgi:hypothetical protein
MIFLDKFAIKLAKTQLLLEKAGKSLLPIYKKGNLSFAKSFFFMGMYFVIYNEPK